MKENDIRQIWEAVNASTIKQYSIEEIRAYQKKQAGNISRLIKGGIVADIGFKLLNLLALMILFFKISNATNIRGAIGFVLLAGIVSVLWEFRIVVESDKLERSKSIIENLNDKLRFMQSTYKSFLFLGPLSNAFFILAGSFWYYYLKYGTIHSLDLTDKLVLGGLMLIGYAVGYFAGLPMYKNQVMDLTSCINDLDDQYLASGVMVRQKRRQKRNRTVFAILLITGILLLLFLVWVYLK